jgi:hypothetical protein
MAELEEIYDVANTKIDELDMMGDDKDTEQFQDMYYEMGVRDALGATFRNCELENTTVYTIRYDAGHDVNGNPVRGYEVLDSDMTRVMFVNEGYAGYDIVRQTGYNPIRVKCIQTVKVTKREFKRISKL